MLRGVDEAECSPFIDQPCRIPSLSPFVRQVVRRRRHPRPMRAHLTALVSNRRQRTRQGMSLPIDKPSAYLLRHHVRLRSDLEVKEMGVRHMEAETDMGE